LDGISGRQHGGFNALVQQAHASAVPGPNALAGHPLYTSVIRLFRQREYPQYFESLDEPFGAAPDAKDGCAWVYIKDTFAIANLGPCQDYNEWSTIWRPGKFHPSLENALREQRLVFQQPVGMDQYDHRDDYFRGPKRPWRLTMAIPTVRLRSPRHPWNEFFLMLCIHRGVVQLDVLGAYFRSGTAVTIVPYAVWA
jgi:hypothetical protein